MAITTTTQANIQPATGTESAAQGDGLHTYEVQDLAYAANNLLWTDPCLTSVMGYELVGSGGLASLTREFAGLSASGGIDGEVFLCELPVLINPAHAKQRWTLGLQVAQVLDGGLSAVDISSVDVIFSQRQYTGAAGVTAGIADVIDLTRVDAYTRTTWATGITMYPASTSSGYVLTSGTSTARITTYDGADPASFFAWALVTVTFDKTSGGNPSAINVTLKEFSCWGTP